MKLRRAISEHSFEAINVTPLIDVVMCLIIFFLLIGRLATDRSVDVSLPGTHLGDEAAPKNPVVITIATGGGPGGAWPSGARVVLDGADVADPASLEAEVRTRLRKDPQASVQIRADQRFAYGAVEPVLGACGRAGATQVRLVTERRP